MIMAKLYAYWVASLLAYSVLLLNSTPVESIQGQHYQAGVCKDVYEDCINEPEFKRCNKSVLTPRPNLTVLSWNDGTALLRCVEYNSRSSALLVTGFSWLKWNQSKTKSNLDIDYGLFQHIVQDDYKYDIQSRVYRQDLHAQYLTIKHLSVADHGVYTCVICSKYGRAQSNVLLKMSMIRASNQLPFSTKPSTTTLTVTNPTEDSSSQRIPSKTRGTVIALFVIGSLVALMIILGIVYAIRNKILKPSHDLTQQPISESPFLNDMVDTSKPFHDSLPPRKWSSPSTVTSFLSRGSTSSTFPIFKQRNSSSSRSPYSGQMMYITEIADLEDVFEFDTDEAWEIPREHVVLEERLGEGAFGIVMKSTAYGLKDMPSQCTVAVKMLKNDVMRDEYEDFLAEIKTMKNIGHHKNIINMLGTCTINGPIFLVVEFAQHGNLRDFLRARRRPLNSNNQNNNSQESLTIGNLTSYAYQAAKGMEYLASKKCVHRDLAARNVLVAQDYVIKIADFGLSRNVKANDYYRKTTHGRLPIMWLSIEALFDQKYTVMSDVWSYGVLLWEIFTLGSSPYPGISIEKLFTLLKSGYRMPSPLNCPPEIYALMLQCWNENEKERPAMQNIVQELDTVLANSSNVEYLDIVAHMTDISSADTNDVTLQTLIQSEIDGQETDV